MNFEIKTIKYFHTIVNSGQFISRKFIEITLEREKAWENSHKSSNESEIFESYQHLSSKIVLVKKARFVSIDFF